MKTQHIPHISASGIRCHVCDASAVQRVAGYETFYRVTSDCKPWPKGGHLGVCQSCGCVEKVIDPLWESEVKQIYEAYSIYHQSEGVEQAVFDQTSGQTSSRSTYLMERLLAQVQLPEAGRLLDVGCGNGALLRSFGRLAPHWSLAGIELNDKYRTVVESINGVEGLYTCVPAEVPGTFNLITLVHTLEHILAPRDFIAQLRDKLRFDGLLVIQIPDYMQNPFDLLIEDHCTHFTVATVTELIQSAGFEVLSIATDWVPKELTVVARKTDHQQEDCPSVSTSQSMRSTVNSLQWLESVVTAAREISTQGNFGLFGTSIAAIWLFSELGGVVDFFVDEDPYRAGKTYMGCPVYPPQEVPSGSHVFIALPTRVAENIQTRMKRLPFSFDCYVPPPLFV